MMVLEKQKFYVPIMCQKRGLSERVKMKEAYLPLPMAIGREMNGYRTADEWPFVCKTDGYPTKVRWPSDSRALGQVYASESRFCHVDGATFVNMKDQNRGIFCPFMYNLRQILHKYVVLSAFYALGELTKCKLPFFF